MDRRKDIIKLKEFRKRLSKVIPIKRMILFGSRAYGKPNKWSDFDLIIVSQKFRKKVSFRRSLGFYKYWGLDYPVDFLCYTPEEFNRLKRQITIVREAVENGIEIK
ncbi:nucleotidyltransferase domain-containing protein [Candidatus Woesearchaeota archaeon]|nr:nucleotidyltransferase domain-containing protein [Candidatus Woesearchaeota archaeon]